MLIFQIEKIATKGHPLLDGVYNVALRVSDNGDCLTTIPRAGVVTLVDAHLLVKLLTMQDRLPLGETGRTVASILADVERIGRDASSAELPSEHAPAIAGLTLLRYQTDEGPQRDKFWVMQRELRSEGIDICIDESGVLVGFSERTEEGHREKISTNLVSRLDMLSDRDGALVDRGALRGKSALIIGLGSIGSVLACDLARCGVGRFALADSERLEWGNVVRHAAGLSDVGRLKSKVVSDLILDRNPNSQVSEITLELGAASRDTYDQAVALADIVVCATDNRLSRLMCNRLCVKHRKKVIFGGLTPGAFGGMVFQFRPPETMCYHCFVSSFPEAAADRETEESAYAGGPDGHLALDIAPITNLMSKLAIVELQKQIGKVPGGLDADLSAPWYIWINRREGEYAELPPLGRGVAGLRVLQWNPVQMEKFEDCPHCGAAPF